MTFLSAARPVSDNLRGSALMVLAMAAFVLNDALVKFATSEIAPSQIMAVRGVMATALLLLLFFLKRPAHRMTRAAARPVGVRAAADVLATISYITALSQLPLANVTAILQALPLAVTLGAVLYLGERPGWRRWSAMGAGFVGVLVIIRPGTDGFTAFSLLVLFSVFCCTVRDLATRRIPAEVPTVLVAAVTAAAVTLTGVVLVPTTGWQPMSPETVLGLVGAAVAIAVGYMSIVAAMRVGDVGFVAPFRYSILLFAFMIGIAFFGEVPSMLDVAGSVIVVASGVYMIYREQVVRRLPAVVPEVQ